MGDTNINKSLYISFLSVIACIAVVYLHTNGCFWTFSTEPYWFSANIIESLFYFAVPIFFMIPGATLLNYNDRYGLKTYFKKRLLKTVVPYLAWSLIAIVINFIRHYKGRLTLSFLKEAIKGILDGSTVNVYWFFPVLFCVYLSIPLLAAVSKDLRKSVFSYLAIACFIINIIIPFLLQILKIQYHFPYVIAVGSGYLFYVLVGYLLHEYELDKKLRVIIYILAVMGLISHIIGTYVLSVEAGEIIRMYKGYNNLPCVLYSIGVFVFVKNIVNHYNQSEKKILIRFINLLKKYTFSIYLMHWFVIQIIINLLGINNQSLLFRIIGPIPIVVICVLITFVLRTIPAVRKIVPE